MSHNRLEYLNNLKVITRQEPISDKPTEVYWWGWFFEQGTYQFYNLFHSKSMITSYKSLKWHMFTIYYLNMDNPYFDLNDKIYKKIIKYITNVKNGFVTITFKEEIIDNIIKEVLVETFDKAPKNRLRKIIFKQGTGLSVIEKLRISGSLIGRKNSVSNSDIYEIMLYIHDNGDKITIKKLAEYLKVSTRTIYRNMEKSLKNEKTTLNEKLQFSKLYQIQT